LTLLLFISIALLGVVLIITLLNALTAPMLKKAPAIKTAPRVSVLVPARNEAANIGACLEGLLKQDYPNWEIFVLDDDSSDNTAAIVQQFSARDRRVKLLAGAPLPAGWLGKNWACHQLSEQATGEIFIFTDADNRYAPSAISHTIGWMQKFNLGLLSAFCHQITETLPEKLAVPVVNMLVYSYLPLWLTYYSKDASLAAANGQWLAFTRAAYEKIGGHRAVRNHVVEDVALSRLAKRCAEKILAVSARDEVFSRMYHSGHEVWEGYSKNLFGLMNFKAAPFFIALALLFFIHVSPYIFVWFKPFATLAVIAIAVNVLIRFVLAIKFAQPVLVSTLLHPFSILYTILIGLNSYRWHKTGGLKWKGRFVQASNVAQTSPAAAGQTRQARCLRYKIIVLYILLLAGGLWHMLGVLQTTMRVLAAPLLIALCLLLCFDYLHEQPNRKFIFWSIFVCVTCFFIELIGVKTGAIFGSYFYGTTLQPTIWNIPVAIGFAWLAMLISAAVMAQYLLPARFYETPFIAASSIAAFMVIFDLFMEPAATKLGYWTWKSENIPLQNYLAWFAFGFILSYIGLRLGLFIKKSSSLALHAYIAQLGYFVLVSLS